MDQILLVDHHDTEDPLVFELTTRYDISPDWKAQVLSQVNAWVDIENIEVEERLVRVIFLETSLPHNRQRSLKVFDYSLRNFHRW